MNGKYFLSYSRIDADDAAVRLTDQLAAGPPPFAVWLDAREIRPGQDWDEQIAEAIRTCRALLFVMTPDGVKPNSMCKREWTRALKYKKPVIPLRFDRDAELPFRLDPREYVDFTDSFDVAMAKLRNHLTWLDTPEGVLQALKVRLADAERELERPCGAPERTRIEQDIKELHRQIAEQEQLLADPGAARARAREHIASGLEREREPDRPVTVRQAKFVNPPPATAPAWFQNRHVETGQIGNFLREDGRRLLTVVGRGGIGKTAMVCRLLKALEGGQLPDDYGPLEVDGIVYLSPAGAHKVTYPNVFADLTRLLPQANAQRLEQRYQDPRQTTAEQMLALLEAFPGGRSVLLLDNFEDVVDSESLVITDPALDEALRTLLTAPGHGIKVILTTRVAPKGLLLVQPALQQRLNLDEGLESPYAEDLLRAMDPDGTLGLKTAPDELLATARERTRGYPRALEALVAIMAADRDTSLPELLAETSTLLPDNVVQALVGEAFNRLDPLAQQVMQALAIYGRPVPPVAVDYLLLPSLVTIESALVLSRLVNMQFVRREAGRYYLHQVDRDYALSRLPAGQPADRDADPAPFTRQALWHRGADYFKQTQTPREEWKTLDDLAPQLAEFELRYQGEDYDTAAAVLQGIELKYLRRWGHYRLAADMNERLIGRLSDPYRQMINAGALGDLYSTLGQTERAIEFNQQALAIARETGDRVSEGLELGALGGLYATLGQTERAIEHYQQALAIARERDSREVEGVWLAVLGDLYRTLGQTASAIEFNQQALDIARETGNRQSESLSLVTLGNLESSLGQAGRAGEHYQQALAIARENGYRQIEGLCLGGIGECYADLGHMERAVDYCQQALAIAREIGDRSSEGFCLVVLGNLESSLGQLGRAVEHCQQALAIARETGDRSQEGSCLGALGGCYEDLGQAERAVEHYQQAVEIGDDIGSAQIQAEASLGLARVHLYREQWPEARQVAESAHAHGFRPVLAGVSAVLGIAYLREGDRANAADAFSAALSAANTLLEATGGPIRVLYAKGIVSAGHALIGQSGAAEAARHTFEQALAVHPAPGLRARALRQLDLLVPTDADGVLTEIRRVLSEA